MMWRVLVVDDDLSARRLMVEILKTRAQCDLAVNGREALLIFRNSVKARTPYDVILLDVQMPEIDGIEVLRQIRDDEEKAGVIFGEGVPVIVVTAYREHFTQMFNLGCDDFIVKPVDAKALIQKMEEKILQRQKGT
jgi:CheY-like chemotaxis protein